MSPQFIASYLDVAFLLAAGILALLIPKKLVGTKGTDKERQNKIKLLKICGATLLVVSVAKFLLHAA